MLPTVLTAAPIPSHIPNRYRVVPIAQREWTISDSNTRRLIGRFDNAHDANHLCGLLNKEHAEQALVANGLPTRAN